METENNNNITITKMTEADLNSIKDILTTEFDNFWNYNVLLQEFLNDTSSLFVATTQSHEIVGFISIQIILDEATITNIVTKKQSRNHGIGSTLLKNIINYCKSQNLKNLTLEVNEKNTSALNLYKKYKFKQTGLRKNYYNGTDNAIIMNLYL